tara:strand:- start:214 stop:624 length:411 start_codon:yes stop_codon:yes gene_type:complete
MIEIINGIFISNISTTYDPTIYKLYNINIVINCTNTYDFINKDIQKIRVPLSYEMNNNDILSLKQNIYKIINIINENICKSNILISCYDGNIISPLIVALYIFNYSNLEPYDIIQYMKTKSDNICIDYDLNLFINK